MNEEHNRTAVDRSFITMVARQGFTCYRPCMALMSGPLSAAGKLPGECGSSNINSKLKKRAVLVTKD
jgi:hypothetical protein